MADSEVLRAEKFAARYFETKAVRFSRAEDALLSVLSALDLPCGSEIVVSANLCTDISDFARSRGLKLVFSGLCPCSFAPSQEDVASKLTERTKAVIVSHSFGRLSSLEDLSEKLTFLFFGMSFFSIFWNGIFLLANFRIGLSFLVSFD